MGWAGRSLLIAVLKLNHLQLILKHRSAKILLLNAAATRLVKISEMTTFRLIRNVLERISAESDDVSAQDISRSEELLSAKTPSLQIDWARL